jgi:hypothetical protein
MRKKEPKLAIIGSGLAGAYTYYRLKKAGYTNIDVYEKNSYMGGTTIDAEFHEKTTTGDRLKTFPACNMFLFTGFYSIIMEEMKRLHLKVSYVSIKSISSYNLSEYLKALPVFNSWLEYFLHLFYIIGGFFSYTLIWGLSYLKKDWFLMDIKHTAEKWKFEVFKDTILKDVSTLFGEYSPSPGIGCVDFQQAETYYLLHNIRPRIVLVYLLNKIIPHIYGANFRTLLESWFQGSSIKFNSRIISIVPLADRVMIDELEYNHVFIACPAWDLLYDIDNRFRGRYNHLQMVFFEGVVYKEVKSKQIQSYTLLDSLVKPDWYRLMNIVGVKLYNGSETVNPLEEIKRDGFVPQHDQCVSYSWKLMKGSSQRNHYFNVYNQIHSNVHLVGMEYVSSPLIGTVVEEIDSLLEKKLNIKSEKPSILRNWYLSFRCMYQAIFG